MPVELIERNSPMFVHRKALREGSGGTGQWRGGPGQEVLFEVTSRTPVGVIFMAERCRVAAPGLSGGGEGAPGEVILQALDLAEGIARDQGRITNEVRRLGDGQGDDRIVPRLNELPGGPGIQTHLTFRPGRLDLSSCDRRPGRGRRLRSMLPRKEVIQPQVLLQLPCYDFTPIADHTMDSYFPCGLAHRLPVQPTFVM